MWRAYSSHLIAKKQLEVDSEEPTLKVKNKESKMHFMIKEKVGEQVNEERAEVRHIES